MLLLSRLTYFLLASIILTCSEAKAGLSGFTSANPYTREEEILDVNVAPKHIVNYRNQMRNNVIMLSRYAKGRNADFEIMVHDGRELMKKGLWEYHLDGYNNARKQGFDASDPSFLAKLRDMKPEEETVGTNAREYMKNIDAVVLNNYFCSKQDFAPSDKLKLISIDNCASEEAFDEAIQDSVGRNALMYGFANPQYAFKDTRHQVIINENAVNINSLGEAQNILFLLDSSLYQDRFSYLQDIRNSNFDVVVISPFYKGEPLTPDEVHSLKFKKNGTLRRVIAAFNISETDDGKYYWKPGWKIGSPSWLKRLSFVDPQGIIVEYWTPEWQKIISNYFKGIVDTGFDGAFLTGLENHQYFEKQTPLE